MILKHNFWFHDKIKSLLKLKYIQILENFEGEVIIKGIKKILKHNNKEPNPNKDRKKRLFFFKLLFLVLMS